MRSFINKMPKKVVFCYFFWLKGEKNYEDFFFHDFHVFQCKRLIYFLLLCYYIIVYKLDEWEEKLKLKKEK